MALDLDTATRDELIAEAKRLRALAEKCFYAGWWAREECENGSGSHHCRRMDWEVSAVRKALEA